MDNVTKALVAVVKNSAPITSFLTGFFGRTVVQDTQYVEMQDMFSKAIVASFVNPDAVADGTESLSFSRGEFKLPTIQDVQTVTSKDLEQIVLGDTEFVPKTPKEKLWYAIDQKIQDQRNMVSNRHELSAIEATFDGKITVLGKGENRVIDFGRPAELTVDIGAVDATLYFGGANEDIDALFDDMIELMAEYGKVCDTLVGTPALIRKVTRDATVKANLDNRRTEIGDAKFHSMLKEKGVIYHGHYKEVAIYSYKGLNGAVPTDRLAWIASENGNVTVNGLAPDITSELGELGIASVTAKDGRNFISNLIPARKSAEVEAIHTGCPMLADVYSIATSKVIA